MDELDSENINDTIELNLTSNIKIVNKLFPVIKKNESDIVVV
jgi:short-subunit dehydrogenase involved in D-alanine esterification of teichoic acids